MLEKKGGLSLREMPVDEPLGRRDVRVAIHTVGICGSGVHYYTQGAIGPFLVVHPEALTFKLPDAVSFAAGAMVEPLAVGVHAVTKARAAPGNVAIAIVIGARPGSGMCEDADRNGTLTPARSRFRGETAAAGPVLYRSLGMVSRTDNPFVPSTSRLPFSLRAQPSTIRQPSDLEFRSTVSGLSSPGPSSPTRRQKLGPC